MAEQWVSSREPEQADGVADDPSGSGQGAGESSRRTILVIEDQEAVARALTIALRLAGHRVEVAPAPIEAYSLLARRRFDAILLDLNFAPGETDGAAGLACLSRLLADDPAACVLVITAHSGVRIAVEAMRAGARDFVMKPWRNAELAAKVEQAIARAPGAPAVAAPGRAFTAPPEETPRLLGESAAMRELRAVIARVAPTRAGVTLFGPSGSGRTLAARALHARSGDPAPAGLVDLRDPTAWERLGTSASVILRHADRLDAVAQARLLERLGSGPRCLAVVDRPDALTPALRRRLATVELAMPPLAARGDDAVLLARHFVQAAAERFGRAPVALSAAAEQLVRETRWPDEVRGLALVVERAVLLAEGPVIDHAALAPAGPPGLTVAPPSADLAATERAVIAAALRAARHNVTHAAAALGLSRAALYRRMARHGL